MTHHFKRMQIGFIKLLYRRFGGDVIQLEITNQDAYACFEQAMLEYSSIVNVYQAKSVLLNAIGLPTGTNIQNQVPRYDLDFAKRIANGYSSEAGVGGTRPLYSASFAISTGVQKYDLNHILSASGAQPLLSGGRAEIRKVFHFNPTAAYRFFDTTSAINYLHNQFQFESFTPETIFYVLPIWEDVLRAQQLELNQQVRRSNYSYGIVNNELTIYPVPTADNTMFFTYNVVASGDPNAGAFPPNDPITKRNIKSF